MVFHDCAGATLDRKLARNLENDVFWRRPAAERTGEADTNDLWPPHIPWEARHDIDGVCTTYADRDHSESASIRGVRVGADHHSARECVVLEHYLVNDSRTGAPETNSVFC